MSKEIIAMVELFSQEKVISKDAVFSAIESALQAITIKQFKDNNITVKVDYKTGCYQTYTLIDGKTTEIESLELNRIGVQTAKQIIGLKMREAFKEKVYHDFKHKEGSILTGTVKKVDRGGNVTLDIGNDITVYIPRNELIPRESIRLGNKLSIILTLVRLENGHAPVLNGSRTSPELLRELLSNDIADILNGKITIMNVARDAGSRAKVSIRSNLKGFDAVKACIGMKGSRIQPIINELAGERIDVILWDANDAQYVINAMSPAEIKSIVIDEDKHSMELGVAVENIPKTIGKNGQNVKLASLLTGWSLTVVDADESDKKNQLESEKIIADFMKYLDINQDDAIALVVVGFRTIEEIAYVPSQELVEVGYHVDDIEELKNRAKDALIMMALSLEEDNQLETIAGMTEPFLKLLHDNKVLSIQDLADLSVYDIEEFSDNADISMTYAGEMIMKAREIVE
jgi:N utilization substance protein A